MPTILIQNAILIDPAHAKPTRVTDILIRDGIVTKIATNIIAKADETIDATGKTVTAGLVDMHVHLREPGREDKETIKTASEAAALGGVTAVLGMPNTNPPIDNQTAVKFVQEKAREEAVVRIFTTGNISHRGKGEAMSEMWEMKNNGVKVFTDDGDDIQDLGLYRRVLQYAKTHDLVLMSHAENHDLKGGICMHEGWVSTQLGLPANPPSTESAHVAHLLELLREVPVPFHFTHLSTARAIELIRAAKKEGLPVTCDVTPHHLILNEAAYLNYNTEAKVCPPLRAESDRLALLAGVADGTVDAIASDHAPHTLVEKFVEFESAAVGMVGLETLFPLLFTHVVEKAKAITLPRLIQLLTTNPAKIMRENVGTLALGGTADLVIWDLSTEYKIDKTQFASKGRNTPFHGWAVRGRATDVFVGGKVIVRNSQLSA